MCRGSKTETCASRSLMESRVQEDVPCRCSNLLELAASDDLAAFVREVEVYGCGINEASSWYGRRIGSRKMGYEERSPLMIAAMFGSTKVLKYIVDSGKVDVNGACGSDKATALHCAAVGGSKSSLDVVMLLLDASADANCTDVNANKPGDLIAPTLKSCCNSRRKTLEMLLRGISAQEETLMSASADHIPEAEGQQIKIAQVNEGNEKKEYPIDVSLPDINTGIYVSDEFRMYSFKIKPCSRAYSHDWTECPFVHPGENARRRDPKKYPYSCVPCPEFRKGSCRQGDACEYAHGVFECWLHPAQYRTRLCKDETGCNRKVCFFAHKPEELRPLYASTGSAIPSPRSLSSSSIDLAAITPLSLGSSSLLLPTSSTPPMSPSTPVASSPKTASMWNKANLTTPPNLQLPGSRLKSSFNARDLSLEMELLGLENLQSQLQKQRLMDEMSSLPSRTSWNKEYGRVAEGKPTNLNDMLAAIDTSMLSQLQGLSSLKTAATPSQLQSPTGLQMRQNMNQLRASYPSSTMSTSPARNSPSFGTSRSASFSNRSHSFVDRGMLSQGPPGFNGTANSASRMSSDSSNWGSPGGKLDWGIQGEELNKLKKSATFAYRGFDAAPTSALIPSTAEEPDVSWVNSLVRDVPSVGSGLFSSQQQQHHHHHHRGGGGVHEMIPPWVEQLYIEQEQMVA